MITAEQAYLFDRIEVRPRAFEALRDGIVLPLEPKSLRVLIYLIERRDQAVGKDELLKAVWPDTAVSDNALTRVIAQLRRELGDDARNPRYIQTIPTLGYRFVGRLLEKPPAVAARAVSPQRWQLVALAALVAAALLWRLLPSPGTERRVARAGGIVQVTSSDGVDLSPSFGPSSERNGDSFVYSSDRNGSFEIYTRSIESGAFETQITNDKGQNVQPAWSPDGRSIAYHSAVKGGIWIVPATGGVPRQIVRSGSWPAWSFDSAMLAYRSGDLYSVSPSDLVPAAHTSIHVVPAAGGQPVQVASTGQGSGRPISPSWTPGGKVLYSVVTASGSELWTATPDGQARSLLLRSEGVAVSPVCNASGTVLYYARLSKTRDYGIWQQALKANGTPEGSPVEVARTGTTVPLYLSLSKNEKSLAYTAVSSSSNLHELRMNGPLTSGAPRPLFKDAVHRSSFPAFSPDGKRIAFFSRLFGGSGDIWVMNADGTGAAPLTSNRTQDGMPAWSRDGSAILYLRHGEDGNQLWRISLSDRSERSLMDSGQLRGWPRPSPDGSMVLFHTLIYHKLDAAIQSIWSAPLDAAGPARQLTFDKEGAGFPVWSPDGKRIAYEVTRGADTLVAVMDSEGSGQRILSSQSGHAWPYDWSPDGSKVLYAGFRGGVWNLWWIDWRTGQQKRLTDFTSLRHYVRYPAWSPAGGRIVFEFGSVRSNIFRLDLEH